MAASVFTALDPRAGDCFLSNVYALETIATGMRWAEGPVWFADQACLVWSDVPGDRMHRWTEDGHAGVFRAPSGFANGNTRDRQGRLVTCEHGTRRVSRTEPDGTITVVADSFAGKRLNSPNDVVVASDGAVWFTDPDYGIMSDYEGGRSTSELGACHVFRVPPGSCEPVVVSSEYRRPNGLAFSPDGRLLYVADSGGSHEPGGPRDIFVHDVEGERLGERRDFARVRDGVPDGIRVDDRGYVWTSAGQSVEVYAPDATPIGHIAVPETVSNLTFGGPRRNRLFITATTSVYAVFTAARGVQTP